MDTYFDAKGTIISDRTIEGLAPILIFMFLVLFHSFAQPPIFANDLIANSSVTTPIMRSSIENIKQELSIEYKKERFENSINAKYRGYIINNVTDGVKHVKITKYFNGRPVKINIIEINRDIAQNYEVKPAIASDYGLQRKSSLKSIANRTNSIAAINGGFFKPQTGVPLGTLMIDEKIYTGPIYDRVALGIFDKGYDVGRVQLNAKIVGNNHEIKIDNINQPRMLSSYVLAYTRDWGSYAPPSPRYGVQLQIEGDRIIKASANPLPIPKNGYVLVGPKSELSKLFGANTVSTEVKTIPKWDNVKHIISGGPYLVKNGQIFIDVTAEKLQSIGGKNPRTAIGYTANNNLILVAVDGREGSSVGLTLNELAIFMKSLGCVNAINLDGGGSTVMYVNGQIVNNPAQKGGIALSNALVVSRKNN